LGAKVSRFAINVLKKEWGILVVDFQGVQNVRGLIEGTKRVPISVF